MSENFNNGFIESTTHLDVDSYRDSAVSVYNIDNYVGSEKAQTIWNVHKKVIVIFIVFFVAVLIIGGALSYIIWAKSKFDLKTHKNYSKFSRGNCTVNYSVNDDFSLLKFPSLVRILRQNGTEEAHSCAATLIASKSLICFIVF